VGTVGHVHQASGFNEPAVMVREMHLGGSRTPATRLGEWPETVAVVLTAAALAGALPLRRRRPTTSNDGHEKAEAR
jgi:apolipoprotein N-acyltransferase